MIVGLAKPQAGETLLAIQRYNIEGRFPVNRIWRKKKSRASKRRNKVKASLRDVDDKSSTGWSTDHDYAKKSPVEKAYSPSRESLYTPSVIPATPSGRLSDRNDDYYDYASPSEECFPHTPGAYVKKESDDSKLTMPLEKDYDDISSATDDILNDVSVAARNSVGSQIIVPADYFERLLVCKRNFPKPGSIVSIDTWLKVFKDVIDEPAHKSDPINSDPNRAHQTRSISVEEAYFEHLMEFEDNFPAPGCVVSDAIHTKLFNANFPSLRANDKYYLASPDFKFCDFNAPPPELKIREEKKDPLLQVNYGASTSRGHVKTPEKVSTDSDRTISVPQSLIDYEIALGMSDDTNEISIPNISPCESMGFDVELFERYLNSVADVHTEKDASDAIDDIINDSVNNNVNMGIDFEENDAGKKNFYLVYFGSSFFFHLFLFIFLFLLC